MTDETITVFRAGTFSQEPIPKWMIDVRVACERSNDWHKGLASVLGDFTRRTTIENGCWNEAEVITWRTPGGGTFVDMMAGELSHAEVWIPDPNDWFLFNATHVEPFLLSRATIWQNQCIDRLTNALIAYARHGEGKHIDRLTGESRIDQREDWERSKRERAAAGPRPTVSTATPAQ